MRRDVGPLRRRIERSNARHMTSGRNRRCGRDGGCPRRSLAAPRLMRWGASVSSDEEEIAGSHPGAGLVLQREIGDDGCHDQRALVGVPLRRSQLA